MTLQEVMNQIPQKKCSTRVPSVSLMLEQDSPVFYDALDDETSASIYSSGFVLFQKGSVGIKADSGRHPCGPR